MRSSALCAHFSTLRGLPNHSRAAARRWWEGRGQAPASAVSPAPPAELQSPGSFVSCRGSATGSSLATSCAADTSSTFGHGHRLWRVRRLGLGRLGHGCCRRRLGRHGCLMNLELVAPLERVSAELVVLPGAHLHLGKIVRRGNVNVRVAPL